MFEDFSIDVLDKIVVIKVNLYSAIYREAQAFWEFMETHQVFNQNEIIIDLSFCSYVDSSFIGMIVKIYRKIDEKEGSLKLVFPQLNDIEAFRVTGITKIIGCYNSIEQAMDGMNEGRILENGEMDFISLIREVNS